MYPKIDNYPECYIQYLQGLNTLETAAYRNVNAVFLFVPTYIVGREGNTIPERGITPPVCFQVFSARHVFDLPHIFPKQEKQR